MHYFLYIDYNKDGIFDVNNGELVAYSYLNGRDSNGSLATIGATCKELPTFQIPTDAATVSTRIRFKCDWESTDPTGNPDPAQNIDNNGGIIIDFTLNINDIQSAEKTYAVTVEQPENGTIEVTDLEGNPIQETVKAGTELTVKATPNNGYELDKILINGTAIEGTNFTVNEATTVSATFKQQAITVTYSITEGSSMTVTCNGQSVASGDKIAKGSTLMVTFNIEENKDLTQVLVNGEDRTFFVMNNILHVPNNQTDVEIKATTTGRQFTITVEQATGGTIEVTDMKGNKVEYTAAYGTELKVTATPDENYELNSIVVNGVVISGNTFIVEKATTVSATFKKQEISVTYSITEGSTMSVLVNGTEVPSGDTIEKGSTLTVKFQIENGKELSEVKVNGASRIAEVSENTLTLTNCVEYIVIEATTTVSDGISQIENKQGYYDAASVTFFVPEYATAIIYDLARNQVLSIDKTTTLDFLKDGCYIACIKNAAQTRTLKFIKR